MREAEGGEKVVVSQHTVTSSPSLPVTARGQSPLPCHCLPSVPSPSTVPPESQRRWKDGDVFVFHAIATVHPLFPPKM